MGQNQRSQGGGRLAGSDMGPKGGSEPILFIFDQGRRHLGGGRCRRVLIDAPKPREEEREGRGTEP